MRGARRLIAAALVLLATSCGNDARNEPEPTQATPAPTAAATASAGPRRTPVCERQGGFTPAQTEGPYFKAGSPPKRDFYAEAGSGTRLTLTGWVVSTDCEPLEGAKLDFWQADGEGVYDNEGFRLRGHQLTDADGRFRLVTVVPGEYPGRTPHIHVKVEPPAGAELTTQLYMPDETSNEEDFIFSPDLVMDVTDRGDDIEATFTFVVVNA